MTELKEPTGNLPLVKGESLFHGTITELYNTSKLILNGVKTVSINELELCVRFSDFTTLECVKILRAYKLKMKPDHPAVKEFEMMVENLMKSISYNSIMFHELKVSRQRNLDLELAIIHKNEEMKEMKLELDKVKKQNESLISGL